MRFAILAALTASSLSFAGSPTLPPLPSACPAFHAGDVSFRPSKLGKERKARIWMDENTIGGGPMMFFFHGMGGNVDDASRALSAEVIDQIVADGGVVIAPYSEGGLTFEWHLVLGSAEDDMYVVDDLVACGAAEHDLDRSRIYLSGFSAGALHSSRMTFLRSEYVAAALIFSGGFITFFDEPENSRVDHKFPVLMYFGGPKNSAFINFKQTTMKMHARLDQDGHPHIVCDHSKGHSIPDADGQRFGWEFLSQQTYEQTQAVVPLEYCQTYQF